MVDPTRLEKAILDIVVGLRIDEWVQLTLGTVRNRLSDMRTDLGVVADGEIVDCICSLEARSLIGVRKFESASYSPFVRARAMEEAYRVQFFWIGSFDLKSTHEGRKLFTAQDATPVAVTTVAASTDEFDDRLPLLRTKSFEPDRERFVKEAIETGSPLALIIVDVDNFGQFNKMHSLEVGNEVLSAVSNALNDRTRGKGKAYRYGGDEMAILLPNYLKPEAISLAEAIRVQVAQAAVTPKKLKVTITLGVASLPEDAQDGKTLFSAANEALLAAKNLGRNLVRAAGDTDDVNASTIPTRRQPASQSPQATDGEIKPGNIVALKSGGPYMTVARLENIDGQISAVCGWFVRKKSELRTFPVTMLVRTHPDSDCIVIEPKVEDE
jgi:diguanylate cyclase (GGDEF)-like protein